MITMIDHVSYLKFCFRGAAVNPEGDKLTPRQQMIYQLLKSDNNVGVIADRLNTSSQSIKVAINEIRAKGWDV